jgi:hypothetical protein
MALGYIVSKTRAHVAPLLAAAESKVATTSTRTSADLGKGNSEEAALTGTVP